MNKEHMQAKQIEEKTVTGVAKGLNIPENTVRKYLSYFNLKVEKQGRKIFLTDEAVECILQIVKLKANGLSLKQIKNIMGPEEIGSDIKEHKADDKQMEKSAKVQSKRPRGRRKTAKPEQQDVPKIEETESENTTDISESETTAEGSHNTQSDSATTKQTLSVEQTPISSESDIDREANNNLEKSSGEEQQHGEAKTADVKRHQHSSKHNTPIREPERDQFLTNRSPLTKESVNKEISVQAKRTSRLQRFLSSHNSSRNSAELRMDLDRRVAFLNGLRYLRDNWIERHKPMRNDGNRSGSSESSQVDEKEYVDIS